MTASLPRSTAVSTLDPTRDPQWKALLANRSASLFHSPPWLLALEDTYGLKIRAYTLNEAPRAGLLYSELNDRGGPRIVSLPFSDACDPLVDSPGLLAPLLRSLQSHQVPVSLRCLDKNPEFAGFTPTKRARWHQIDIARSMDQIWSGFHPATRRAIRKAERSQVEIRPLNSREEVEDFHRLHVSLRKRKYHMLAQPLSFFLAIWRRFREIDGWFSQGAFQDGRLIAGTVYLRWGDTMYYKFNASDPGALDSRPNNLLVWDAIRFARELGCATLDLGPSDDDQPGLIRFKRNFGARERELRFLRWAPAGWDGSRAEAFRLELTNLTTAAIDPRVPDEQTARAGEELYRYFA